MSTRALADIVGSSHINGTYAFGGQDSLNEGADLLLEMGTRVIKVIMREDPASHYRFGEAWPPVASLVEQACTPQFRRLFAKPFTTFIVMAFAPERPIHYFLDAMTPDDEAAESERIYRFARHLLDAYAGSGKTFVIQNWESDWVLTPPLGATTPVPSRDLDDAQAERMIAWCGARQAGVDRARREAGAGGVTVLHALEVNLLARAMAGERRVANVVVPHTRCDLYSYSAWDTLEDPARLRDALDYLRDVAPATGTCGRDNIFVGEFGAAENLMGGPEGQLRIIRRATEAALDREARYVVYWQLTCDGPVRSCAGRPEAADLSGWWLIRPDGSLPPVNAYLRSLMAT